MNDSAPSSNTPNNSDGSTPPSPLSPPVPSPTALRDRRIDSLLGVANLAEKRFDEAGGNLAGLLAAKLDEIEDEQAVLLARIGGPYLAAAQKADKRFDRAHTKLSKLLNTRLSELEFERDAAVRQFGGDVPMVISEIANAVADGKLDQLADKYMTIPMAEFGMRQQLTAAADPLFTSTTIPVIDEPLSPPPWFPDPVPVDEPPPIWFNPDPPAVCRPPSDFGLQFTGPITAPGQQPPFGDYEIGFTDPATGCRYWRPRQYSPPPVGKDPPKVPPVVPPVSSCLPGDTVQIGCVDLAYPWQSNYWVLASCGPSCSTRLCIYYGPNPPTPKTGEFLYGPYTTPPDGAEQERIARAVCKVVGTAPPESPPTSPPVPGVPVPMPIGGQPPVPGQPNDPPIGQPPAPAIPAPGGGRQMEDWCGSLQQFVTAANGGSFGDPGTWFSTAWTKFVQGDGKEPAMWDIPGQIIKVAGGIVGGGIGKLIEGLSIPNATAQGTIQTVLALAGWGERITSAPISYLAEEWAQTMRYATPLFVPDQAAANSQYYAGVISEEDWVCLTRSNGNKPDMAKRTVMALRPRTTVADVITLFRKGQMPPEVYRKELRERGVLTDDDVFQFEQSVTTTPQVSDIFRYIKRDVTNEEFVRLGNLDEGFTDAYSGEMKEFGRVIGLSELQAKYEYRSEWEFPGKVEATQMFRRLRPGKAYEVLQPNGKGGSISYDVPAFTIEDYMQVLKVNDVAPGFRERMMYISSDPINLTEIKALQKNGLLTYEQTVDRLIDYGKSPTDAPLLADLVVRDNARMLSNETGGWTRRKVFKEFADGSISYAEADKLLERTVPNKETRELILSDAVFHRTVEARKECIRGIKRRFFTAEIEPDQATRELVAQGVSEDAAFTLLEGWKCKRASRSKEPTVKLLTEWWIFGVISVDELYLRLQRLGYTIADARRIVIATTQKEEEKRRKAEEAALEKAERKRRQIEREQKAAERDRLRGRPA